MAEYLIDTNVLIAYSKPEAPEFRSVAVAVRGLRKDRHRLCISPQIATEFWSMATRRKPRGLSWTAADTSMALTDYMADIFELRADPPNLFEEWQKFCVANNIVGPHCYDARIAVLMNLYGLVNILTFNTKHFASFPGIHAIDPATI